MKRLKKNKNFFLIIFIIVIILIVITTVSFTLSYGYFKTDKISTTQTFKSGSFNIRYSMGRAVTIDYTYPMSDRAGNATDANTITINNTGDYYACYALTLTDSTSSSSSQILNKSQMRYSINKAARDYDDATSSKSTLLLGGAAAGEEITLNFRTWIKDTETDDTATDKSYSGNLQVEAVSCKNTLGEKIFHNNSIKTTSPTLTKSATDANENGLYKVTTDNGTTYVFRGNVSNNFVLFAGCNWRIIRVNEDGTIRMISDELTTVPSSTSNLGNSASNLKYNNSILKDRVNGNFSNSNYPELYNNKIAYSSFCDEFKVTSSSEYNYKLIATNYDKYTPTMNCKNPLSLKVGLITYDEMVFSGLNVNSSCLNCYLESYYSGIPTLSMSPSGYKQGNENYYWGFSSDNNLDSLLPSDSLFSITPVLSLNANVEVTGNGTLNDPYVVN